MENKIQTSPTVKDLQQILHSDTVPARLIETVDLLRAKQFKTLSDSMPISMKEIVKESLPMMIVSKAAEKELIAFIEFELIKLSTMVNIDARLNIQKHQVPLIAENLYDSFKYESMEDISLCLRRGAMGRYSPEGIFRLDGAVITSWMSKYLEEKYQVVENNVNAQKEDPEKKTNTIKNFLELYKAVVGDKPIEDETNESANSYQRWKLQNGQYKYYDVFGLQIYATSQEKADKIVQGMIERGEVEIVDNDGAN